MSRHILTLTKHNRGKAIQGVTNAPDGYVLELREAKRTDPQNAALWGLLHQIQRQRPVHNGVKMTPELWKCVFLDALGQEMTKGEFAALLTVMLAWTAQEGLTVEHFDGDQGAGGVSSPARLVA